MPDTPLQGLDRAPWPHLVIKTPYTLGTLAYLPDGRVITSCSSGERDGMVTVWNLETGLEEGTSMHREAEVMDISVTQDGKKAIAFDRKGTVNIWDTKSHHLIKQWINQEKYAKISISPDDRLIAVGGKVVTIYGLEEGKVQRSIEVGKYISCLSFSPSGDKLACSVREDVLVYDTANGALLAGPLTGHQNLIQSVVWSRDGNKVFSGSCDQTIRCWNINAKAQINGDPWTGHTDEIRSLSLSLDGLTLASASRDKTVRFWNTTTGDPIGLPLHHQKSVYAVCFCPINDLLVSATWNGEIYLWRMPHDSIWSQLHPTLLDADETRVPQDPPVIPYLPAAQAASKLPGPPRPPTSLAQGTHHTPLVVDQLRQGVASPPPDLTPYISKIGIQHVDGGSFGDVYKCWEVVGVPKMVAVKALRFKFTMDEGVSDRRAIKMLHRELGIWRRLQHINVVPFLGIAYGFGMDGAMSLVSLWMSNGSLHRFLAEYNDTLGVGRRLQFLLDIATGLQYLHSFPFTVVHGDLNCHNVLVDENYIARLTDFGYASLVGDIPEALAYLQRSTARAGALRWAAPERVLSEDTFCQTTESDIYSFGCVSLEVLSGKRPWSEVQNDNAIIRHMERGDTPARPVCRTLNDSHWSFIQKCWSQMGKRPATEDVIREIQHLLDHSPRFQPLRDLVFSWSSPSNSLADESSPGQCTALKDRAPSNDFNPQPSSSTPSDFALFTPHRQAQPTLTGMTQISSFVPPGAVVQATPIHRNLQLSHATMASPYPIAAQSTSPIHSYSFKWIDDDGIECSARITWATTAEHLTSHGIKGVSSGAVLLCGWSGCQRRIARTSIARHIWEAHLGERHHSLQYRGVSSTSA